MSTNVAFLVLAIYFALLFIAAWWSRLRGPLTVSSFAIDNRKTGIIAMACSIVVSIWDPNGLVLLLSFIVKFGFGAWWLMQGVLIGTMAFAILLAPKLNRLAHEKGYLTVADLIRDRMGESAWKMFNLMGLVLTVIRLSIGTKLIGILMAASLGYASTDVVAVSVCSAVALALTLAYMWVGGYRAVLGTDVLQTMLTMLPAIAGVALLMSGVIHISWENVTTQFWGTPEGYRSNLTLLVLLSNATFWDTIQRAFSAPTPKHAVLGGTLATALIAIIYGGLTLLGLGLVTLYPGVLTGDILQDPNLFTTQMVNNPAVAWFGPVFMMGMLALFMSTLDSGLFHLAVMQTQAKGVILTDDNTVGHIRKQAMQGTLYVLGLSMLVENILTFAIQSVGLYVALAPFFIAATWYKNQSKVYSQSMASAMVASSILWLVLFLNQKYALDSMSGANILGWFNTTFGAQWQGFLPCLLSVVLVVAIIIANRHSKHLPA